MCRSKLLNYFEITAFKRIEERYIIYVICFISDVYRHDPGEEYIGDIL